MEIVAAVSAMLGVAWASGINLYAAVLMLGVLMLGVLMLGVLMLGVLMLGVLMLGVLGSMGSVDLPCEN